MPDSTIEDLDNLLTASKRIRRRFEQQVYLNSAFFQDQQWVAWDGRKLYEPQLEPWRARITDNRIKPAVRNDIAKMTKTRPTFVGVPRTQGTDDIAAARYAEQALEYQWRQQDLLRKLRGALTWSRIAGAGYWKVWWDRTLGDPIEYLVYAQGHEKEGEYALDGRGQIMTPDSLQGLPPEMADQLMAQTVYTGDLRVDLRTFFHIYPDPLATEDGLESADWVIEEAVYSMDYARQRFPGANLEADASPSAGVSESRMPFADTTGTDFEGGKGVRIREYWRKPSGASPRGRYACWAQNQMLAEGDNPYPWLPYIMFRGIPVPGRFYPDAPVTSLISPQVQINKLLSQFAENSERIGNPPLLKPSTAADWEWHGLPGEQIEFQPTGGPDSLPQFMQVPELPAYSQNLLQTLFGSIQEISGQHEVSSAQVPAGVTAASAINLLQEQDDTRLGPDIADMEETIAGAGRRVLWLMVANYDDERHVRISGRDGQWDVFALKGDMLAGCEDIEVQAGSGIPQSQAAKQAAISAAMNLFIQNGEQIPPKTMRKVLQEYGVSGLETFYADVGRDEQQINEENRLMALGEQLPTNSGSVIWVARAPLVTDLSVEAVAVCFRKESAAGSRFVPMERVQRDGTRERTLVNLDHVSSVDEWEWRD
jgi:hypothetical protein